MTRAESLCFLKFLNEDIFRSFWGTVVMVSYDTFDSFARFLIFSLADLTSLGVLAVLG